MFIASGKMTSPSVEQIAPGINAVEGYKASMNGDGLRIRELLPEIIERGAEALTPAEKELLKWIGVFFRKPTPGKFMTRIRMPNGFARSEQLRTIAELSRRLGNSVLDITTLANPDIVAQIREQVQGRNVGPLKEGPKDIKRFGDER